MFVDLYLVNKHNGLSGYPCQSGGIKLSSITQQK